jgi:MFS family permease
MEEIESYINPAQRWNMFIVVISSVSVVGLSLGFIIPLVSLVLEQRGLDSTLIGLMGAMPAFGILIFAPLVPLIVRHLGAQYTINVAIAVTGTAVLVMPFIDRYGFWMVMRFLSGAAINVLFVISETWINQIAVEQNRGRMVAIYTTTLPVFIAIGPVLINLTGTDGILPFLVASLFFYIAILPQIGGRGKVPLIEGSASFNVFAFFKIAPILSAGVFLFAYLDGTGLSILPVYGLRHGFSVAESTTMVTALIIGYLALTIPVGWLADKVERQVLLFLCGCLFFACSMMLPLIISIKSMVWPVLFLLGASGSGIYTLAMILIGQRFKGPDLATASAAFSFLFGMGHLVGPIISGVSMRILDPDGFPITLILAVVSFLILIGHRHLCGKKAE